MTSRAAKEEEESQRQLREQFLAELRGGPESLRRWNRRNWDRELSTVCPSFASSDLTGAELTDALFCEVDFQNSRFDRATLRHSKILWQAQFQAASFKQADLTEVEWQSSSFDTANFEGACLVRAQINGCSFKQANFTGADLTGARFRNSTILQGTDLSSANLKDVDFGPAWFDEHTRFPPGFSLPDSLRWQGQGPDPRTQIAPTGPVTFPDFLKHLGESVEAARLTKALDMLKTDRFQLFARVNPDAIIGVVKSQSDPTRVYSCRLAAGGEFACCSHRLNPCGGQRNAPCKHLLVLVIGLARAGQMDVATADAWMRSTKYHAPQIDHDVMADALLQYKGAEAGEIDWRPTETIPEDYYAL
jgi:uncharacterized protein YjbI with pentapeptide repeats